MGLESVNISSEAKSADLWEAWRSVTFILYTQVLILYRESLDGCI